MKETSRSNCAFINLRILTAILFCCVGGILAFSALGNAPEILAGLLGSEQSPTWLGKLVAAYHADSGEPDRLRAKRNVGVASMNTDADADRVGASARVDAGPVSTAVARTVSKHRNELGQTVYAVSPIAFDVSEPLTKMAKATPRLTEAAHEREELPFPKFRIPKSNQPDSVVQVAPARDTKAAFSPRVPSSGFNFLGVIGGGSFPPDTNGSVGNDQYVETVNTRYQVWSLNRITNTPTSIVGPVSINTLWSGFAGGNCATRNDGDPITVYDKLANRWLISQFTTATSGGSYYQCVAISQTANAAGSYFRYAFAVPTGFGDYPHIGVWTDAYYMMAHVFTSAGGGGYVGGAFAAMDRTKMLAGDAGATWQVIIDPDEGGHLPADVDGFAPPPGNAPGIFASLHSSGMYLYRMKVDFVTPANTVRTLQAIMPTAPATAACGGGNCIPQPGSTATIDSLGDRLMFRLGYRNFIDHESLVVSHSVDPAVTGLVSGIRWYDFRISGQSDAVCPSYPCTYQQGTIADAPNQRSRWMPSIAMDGAENVLVGYSATGLTSGSDNHSIRYTGRAKSDPLGTMTAPEAIIFTGTRNVVNTGTQPARWGDYSSTSVDPADDCTFWHANEYYSSVNSGNGNWKTQIGSARYPEGTGAGQCQSSACTSRPASAPTIGTASVAGDNQIQITWTGISPTPGSYAIERAIGSVGSEGLYQPLAAVPGTASNFTDTAVQGGITYTYRIIAATDTGGRCQAFARSGGASATATGQCSLKPAFAGATSASSANTGGCGILVNWTSAASNCSLSPNIRYNIFRGTVPNFVPSVSNRIATCVSGPSSYLDTNNLTNGATYYYVVRAEDGTAGNGGECAGGNEESNSIVVGGTAYGSGTSGSASTWTDGGGDVNASLQLNVGIAESIWRIVNTTDDAGANHTPGGAFAYRNAGPSADAHYPDNICALSQTPVLTVGATSVNLTYYERHQLEYNWDGVAVEYSLNGGPWTSVPTPSNLPTDGCVATDVITDWSTLSCTDSPPINACNYPTTTPVITGPLGGGTSCSNWATANPSAYARRCHRLTGLTPGATIQFRWRFSSDPGANFVGFYLDDIAVTNIRLPNSCSPQQPTAMQMTGAASRQSHGANNFEVPLPGTEPRSGVAGDYPVRFTFTNTVNSVDSVITSCGSITSSGVDGVDAHNFIVHLNGGSCNGQNVTVTLNGIHDNMAQTLASASATVGLLIGDTTGDGAVNSGDISQTKSQSGAAVTGANFRTDVNHDGSINSADVSQVKSRSGTALP